MTRRPRNYLADLLTAIRLAGLPEPVTAPHEHRFALDIGRKWAFDACWPDDGRVALEYEGDTWGEERSGHTTGKGYRDNCQKYNEAAIRGWIVIRVTADMVDSGEALDTVMRALQKRGGQ